MIQIADIETYSITSDQLCFFIEPPKLHFEELNDECTSIVFREYFYAKMKSNKEFKTRVDGIKQLARGRDILLLSTSNDHVLFLNVIKEYIEVELAAEREHDKSLSESGRLPPV